MGRSVARGWEDCQVIAPTNAAVVNASNDGRTCHKFFGLSDDLDSEFKIRSKYSRRDQLPDVIIIDVRSKSQWEASEWKIKNSVWEDPAEFESWANFKYARTKIFVLSTNRNEISNIPGGGNRLSSVSSRICYMHKQTLSMQRRCSSVWQYHKGQPKLNLTADNVSMYLKSSMKR